MTKESIEEYLEYEALSHRISLESRLERDVGTLTAIPELYRLHTALEHIDTSITDTHLSQEGIKDFIKEVGNTISQAFDDQLDKIRHFITFMTVNEIKLKKYRKHLNDFPEEEQVLYFKANPFFRYGDGTPIDSIPQYIEKLEEVTSVIDTLLKTTALFTNSRLVDVKNQIVNLAKDADAPKHDVLHATGDAIETFALGLRDLPGTKETKEKGITHSPTYLGMFSVSVSSPTKVDHSTEKTYAKSISHYDVNINKDQVRYKDTTDKVKLTVTKKELDALIQASLSLVEAFKRFDSVTNRLTEKFNDVASVLSKLAFVVTIPVYFMNAQARLTYRAMTLVSKNNPKAFVIAKHHVENILHVVEQFMSDK